MSRILLCTDSVDLADLLRFATSDAIEVLPLGPLPNEPAALWRAASAVEWPAVVVLDADTGLDAALDLTAALVGGPVPVSVVLVSRDADRIALAALRSGAHNVVRPDDQPADLRAILDHAAEAAATLPVSQDPQHDDATATPRGRVISVVSPKGGVGKTTVSTNLAVGLAARCTTAPEQGVVLVDLDIQFGDVASALDLEPEFSVADAVTGAARHDSMVLKTYLTQHETGLYVLTGPKTPAEADAVEPDDVARLLRTLAAEFRFVVVDTAPGMQEHTLAAMDQTTDLVLLTSMDVPGVRGLRKELDTLAALELQADSRHIVLNFADPKAGLSVADVEATLEASVDLTLPRSHAVPISVNQGTPLLQTLQRDPVTRQLQRLVSRFIPEPLSSKGRWGRRPHAIPRRALRKNQKVVVA